MDLIARLNANVNAIPNLPIKCQIGYLKPTESFCLYPQPGGRVVNAYYDGTKDQQLNFEFAMKSTDQQKISQTLWLVQNHLEGLSELISLDGSFDFDEITVTNKPFINQLDDKSNYIFMLDIQVKVTTYK